MFSLLQMLGCRFMHNCFTLIHKLFINNLLNEKKIAYSFKLSDDTSSNLGQDLEGK